MDNKQSLFWEIALPLTALVMGSILFIAYNGDELRGKTSGIYRKLMGKQDTSANARGISVAQRKRATHLPSTSSSTLDYRSIADEAEFLPPRPDWTAPQYFQNEKQLQNLLATERHNKSYVDPVPASFGEPSGYEPYSHGSNRYDSYRPSQIRGEMAGGIPPPTMATTYASPAARSQSYYPPPPPQAPGLSPGVGRTYGDPSAPPTFIKIHKKFLDIDTLAFYNLPWEYDTLDPEYYVIFQDMSPNETDMLFEHTKRLREGRSSGGGRGDYVDYGGDFDYRPGGVAGRNKSKEYAWVRKRAHRRRRQNPSGRTPYF